MPSLYFVLPHWLYWGTLIVFPLVAWALVRRQRLRGAPPRGPSLFIAYLFWLCAGFIGLHRLYLKNLWGLAFVPVLLGVLYVNGQIRDAREDVSRTRAALEAAHSEMRRATPEGATPSPQQRERLAKAAAAEAQAKDDFAAMQREFDTRSAFSHWLAGLLAVMLLADAVLLPGLVRRTAAREAAAESSLPAAIPIPDIPPVGTHEDPTLGLHTRLTDMIEAVNIRVGEFVAYWAVISVFVYYYEVVARYVFNSPTNWAHESMFLMYGMQYMLAGAYAYQSDQHVRVDVIYTKFSARGKAIADIVTSVFFFIFVITMLWTGSRFALDAIGNLEVSFTEWAVQYWPVKLMIPVGAALLVLQGLSKLIKDIVLVARTPG